MQGSVWDQQSLRSLLTFMGKCLRSAGKRSGLFHTTLQMPPQQPGLDQTRVPLPPAQPQRFPPCGSEGRPAAGPLAFRV